MVKLYLDEGLVVDVNQRHSEGQCTALHVAALNGHDQICDLLLHRGAFVDMIDSEGAAPIQFASYDGDVLCLMVLIRHGADINVATSEGLTPLMLAAAQKNLKIVKILLDKGARMDQQNADRVNA